VTGWELDGLGLDALGELAVGQRCPECACPLDEHAPDGGHAIDCIVVNCSDAIGRVVVPGIPPCRVRACLWPSVRVGHCVKHDTPEVRAMSRPHQYVFNGRRIVLESQLWDELPAEAQQMAVITTSAPIAPALTAPPSLAPRATGRPCWAWCGRPGPAPHCHPASRYGRAPTFPCLVCGREIHACEGNVLLCRDDCAEFVRDLETLGPAQTSAGAGRAKGKRKLATSPHRLRLPRDVIAAAQQRALDLSADLCRHVSRQEVYRGLVAGELAPLAVAGGAPWKSETLWLTAEQSARLHACAEKRSLSLPGAADLLCRNAEF
jgi:hypothetical protein